MKNIRELIKKIFLVIYIKLGIQEILKYSKLDTLKFLIQKLFKEDLDKS